MLSTVCLWLLLCGCTFSGCLLKDAIKYLTGTAVPTPPCQLYYVAVVFWLLLLLFSPEWVCVNLLVCFAVHNTVIALKSSRLSAWRIFAFIDAVKFKYSRHTLTHACKYMIAYTSVLCREVC